MKIKFSAATRSSGRTIHEYPALRDRLVAPVIRRTGRRGVLRCILSSEDLTVSALADRITVDPQQCGGRPCVRGLRIRVTDVLDLLASGLSPAQVIDELPDLELEDVSACLRFASRRLDHPIVAA
jgi:uncharacterized protein (DUF433 family)